MKFTKIPENTFKELQMNTGVLLDTFTPASGTVGNILGATTGGISFADALTFTDFGEDIDNCPKNTMELKRLDSHEVTLSGTYVTATAASVKKLMAVALAGVMALAVLTGCGTSLNGKELIKQMNDQ